MAISYIGSSNAATTTEGTASLSATLPTGIATNDLLIAMVGVRGAQQSSGGNTDPGLSTPNDWTLLVGAFDAPTVSTSYGFRLSVYYRKVTGSEAASYTWTSNISGSGHIAIGISAYRGVDTVNGYSVATNPGDGTATSYSSGNLTIGANVATISVYGDRTGSTQSFSGGNSSVKNRVETNDATMELADSAGVQPAGTYHKTLSFTNPTGVGVFILFGVSAAADTTTNPTVPPTINSSIYGPATIVDARQSAAGQGGILSYTVEYVSGPVLKYEQVATGYFTFIADDTDDAVYNLVLSETGNSASPSRSAVTIGAINDTPTGTGGGTTTPPSTTASINETVVRVNGQWV